MKRIILIAIPVIVLAWGFSGKLLNSNTEIREFAPLDTSLALQPNPELEKKASVVINLITRYHYKKLNLNDSLSSIIFDNFIEDIDADKSYLTEADLKNFEKYRFVLDDELMQSSKNLNIPYLIYNTYIERVQQRIKRNKTLLNQKFDLTQDEFYETDAKKRNRFSSEQEADKEWKKILKNQMITSQLASEKPESIPGKLKERYDRYLKSLSQTRSEDVFQVYMNAVSMAYDPHTNYLSPIAKDNFNMNMRRSLEGIGAVLSTEGDYTIVREVRPGGPAFKSKKLFRDDRIIAVAQGTEEMVDVVGWRLDEVIQLIRGPKGTVVRLRILSASDGTAAKPIEIKMVRERITFEEQSATKQIIELQEGSKKYRMGVINVPAFYINFEEYQQGKPDYKSTTNDVKKLVQQLLTEKIDGIIIDLRYNGGGSLKEAIDLTSLFIQPAPVVQVKDINGRISVGETEDVTQLYKGPLVVMTNRFSASASEIFAGAIQDYRRGILIGEQTYGKGTVQNVHDLSRYLSSEDDNVGQLNLTHSKYYRASGSSVQNKGVTPDIKLLAVFDEKDFGESAYPSSLPWDEINPARGFSPTNEVSTQQVESIKKAYQKRLNSDDDLKKLIKDIQQARKEREETKISLNLSKRLAEKEAEQKLLKEQRAAEAEDEEEATTTETNRKPVEQFTQLKDLYLKNATRVGVELIRSEQVKITQKN